MKGEGMKPVTIVAQDKVGLLADISYILSKNKINIETISASGVGGKAIIILTVSNSAKALDVLSKNGYGNLSEDYIVVKVKDTPGSLSKLTAMLASAKINIENVHLLSRDGKNSLIAFKVDKTRKARELFKDVLAENDYNG